MGLLAPSRTLRVTDVTALAMSLAVPENVTPSLIVLPSGGNGGNCSGTRFATLPSMSFHVPGHTKGEAQTSRPDSRAYARPPASKVTRRVVVERILKVKLSSGMTLVGSCSFSYPTGGC